MQNILDEISKVGADVRQTGVFTQYKDKSGIGELILKELLTKKYSFSQRGKKGFFLAENERSKIGVLSQCIGLQSISLLRNYNIDALKDEKDRETRLNIIKDTFTYIVNALKLTQEKVDHILKGNLDVSVTYDCTPYFDNEDVDDESIKIFDYVDTAAKVLETFCEFRGMYEDMKKNGYVFQLEGFRSVDDTVEALIIKSMHDLNVSAMRLKEPIPYTIGDNVVKDEYGEDILYKGWNYCDMYGTKAESSLYFTYAVCSAYMAFAGEFHTVIEMVRAENKKMSGEQLRKKKCPEIDCAGDKSLEADYVFFKKLYDEYVALNKECVDAGHYVDLKIREGKLDISKDFVGFGFSKISFDEIANSTTNDAMINTVFVLLIYLYSGTDLDYAAQNKGDDFSNLILYSTQNVLKSYKLLERNNQTYIVDQYVLNFNEQMSEDRFEQVRLLRKQRIYTISLMPLLIKAYTAIAKYLIKYPQKEMKDFLRIILTNRCVDKSSGKKMWLWDKDGYNIMVNMYYILNLQDFYSYYEKYEFPYTGDADSYNNRINALEKEYKQTLDAANNEAEQKIKALQAQIENLLKEKDKLHPIESEVIGVVEKYLDGNLIPLFVKILNSARESNIDDGGSDVSLAFKRFFMSYFFDAIKSKIDIGDLGNEKLEDSARFKELENVMFMRFAMWMDSNLSKELGI